MLPEHSDAADARRIVEGVATEKSVQKEVTEGAMWEKSLRAKAIPGLRLRLRGSPAFAETTGDGPGWKTAPD